VRVNANKRITIKHPEGGYSHICPFDNEECDQVRITSPEAGGMQRKIICRHSHKWDVNATPPCMEERKRKKTKQKIKRKVKIKGCGCK